MPASAPHLLPTAAQLQGEALRLAYAAAKRSGAARHRDVAASLGVSEGELIAAHAGAEFAGVSLVARRLQGPWPALVTALESAGEVMALTRNAACVHEKTGIYCNASASGEAGSEVGLVLGEEIDLRLFYRHWVHGFAVDELSAKGLQSSLQFFDARGVAVHKVFARERTQRDAWIRLVARFMADEQRTGIHVADIPTAQDAANHAEVDVAGFRQAWASMRDTHEFFGVLKRFGLSRTQALRLADERFAQPIDNDSVSTLLHEAVARGVPIMVFVGNPGAIQIHSGIVRNVAPTGPWINVLDAGFNLHLRQDQIHSAWIVRKPTSDGLVSSLEVFDAAGETVAMFFGERKPGRSELCAWRELLQTLAPDAIQETRSCAC
jgi:putative hemin transport protein